MARSRLVSGRSKLRTNRFRHGQSPVVRFVGLGVTRPGSDASPCEMIAKPLLDLFFVVAPDKVSDLLAGAAVVASGDAAIGAGTPVANDLATILLRRGLSEDEEQSRRVVGNQRLREDRTLDQYAPEPTTIASESSLKECAVGEPRLWSSTHSHAGQEAMNESRTLAVSIPTLDDYLHNSEDFSSALPRLAAAIACIDGPITLAELSALSDMALGVGGSTVFSSVLMDALEREVPFKRALDALRKAAESLDPRTRESGWQALKPIVALQHHQALAIARKCCEALGLEASASRLAGLPEESSRGFITSVIDQAKRITGRDDIQIAAEELASATGDPVFRSRIDAYKREEIDAAVMRIDVGNAMGEVRSMLLELERQAAVAKAAEASSTSLIQTATKLRDQVEQRLAVVEERLRFERQTLEEDIDDAVYDAGESIELSISDRLRTDKWSDSSVWESIAKQTFGKEMERRIDRIVRRRVESLRLLKEDLRIFQNEVRLTHASLGRSEHHAMLAQLMPTLRFRTSVLTTVDSAASYTLAGGAVSTAAVGTAVYFLGAATVLPVIAPAVPFIGGAAVIAGLFKWLTDSEKWKVGEIRDKRRAFEGELRKRLRAAEVSYNAQLDELAVAFVQTADQMLRPVMLEAAAANRVVGMQQRLTGRVLARCRTSLQKIGAMS